MFGSHPVYSHSKVCMQKLTIEKSISMDIQVCVRVCVACGAALACTSTNLIRGIMAIMD